MADTTRAFRYKDFGERVRRWRQSVQPPMTQRELATKIDVTSGFLAHVETGRTLPGVRTIVAIARALGVPLQDVLRAAGYLSSLPDETDEALLEPELRVFFSQDWKRLSEDERDLLRDFVRMLKLRLRRRRLSRGTRADKAASSDAGE
ncbi:MAG: helix-turn-helix transcriptional regulator [Dehalococcoidia bacterium]|nr:helix-turn-helix transcriptional regulator [Dehalococcoidia bacterium]